MADNYEHFSECNLAEFTPSYPKHKTFNNKNIYSMFYLFSMDNTYPNRCLN